MPQFPNGPHPKELDVPDNIGAETSGQLYDHPDTQSRTAADASRVPTRK